MCEVCRCKKLLCLFTASTAAGMFSYPLFTGGWQKDNNSAAVTHCVLGLKMVDKGKSEMSNHNQLIQFIVLHMGRREI